MNSRLLVFTFLFAAMLLFSSCTSEEVQQYQANLDSVENLEATFDAEITLCRKIGRKSGRRIGVGREFKVSKKSYVRAFADFENVKADRPYVVHLVWIRPDGKEIFRKYARVFQDQVEEGEFRTVINWLSAKDLHKVKSDTLYSSEPDFTLETRFNISEKKARTAGLYHFRVYLDRRLLLEEAFTVFGPAILTPMTALTQISSKSF